MNTPDIRIGLPDSGVAPEQAGRVAAARGFALDGEGRVAVAPVAADRAGHGARLAEIILAATPQARLLNAQVFREPAPAAPAVIAAAVEWLLAEEARVINMSFGLRQDRDILRRACALASGRGVLLVCAAPARGGPVFPAAYPGAVSVCGDNRCGPGEWSVLPDGPAYLGACPRPLRSLAEDQRSGGASFAAAHLSAALTVFLAGNSGAGAREALEYLESHCRFYGRERHRLSPGPLPP